MIQGYAFQRPLRRRRRYPMTKALLVITAGLFVYVIAVAFVLP